MEDMARLAVFEQNARDTETFTKTLIKLVEYIRYILENPDDDQIKTIRSESLKKSLDIEGFADYLKYIGFQIVGKEIVYPKNQSLNQLRMAEAAIERKLHFTHGNAQLSSESKAPMIPSQSLIIVKNPKLVPVHVLRTKNHFLQMLEQQFNEVLKHEEEELQAFARRHIPLVNLQMRALDRMREQQRKLKTGEIKGHDMNFDIALLMELLGWFKHSFFSWVDRPPCQRCAGDTELLRNSTMTTPTGNIRLELYKCKSCPGTAEFPRYKDGRSLLKSRRGRCGEWADCFTLLCRSLGYDTRYVWDSTDHVWCEIFDYDSKRWLHVDPCEAKLDAPLIYSHGWGKKLQYVMAFSRDDLQDVTWRYTSAHAEVRQRRNFCTETELVTAILLLRDARQGQLSEVRRRYLAKRTLCELVDMMVEKKPSDYESHGRISGSREWRSQRGEIGRRCHTFEFTDPATYRIAYCTSIDKYRIYKDNVQSGRVEGWADGTFGCKNLFRKEEVDWRMAYLAREEGSDSGSISWRISATTKGLRFTSLSIRPTTKLYETGRIDWTLTFDTDEPLNVEFGSSSLHFSRQFKDVIITADLSGGVGDVSWQHAQLFRQSLDDKTDAFDVVVIAENGGN